MSLPLVDAPPVGRQVSPVVLGKGFRPFFLLAAGWAAVALPVWLAVLEGHLSPGTYLAGPFWHAHEMLFGFTVAVVAGFLLTAIANWTQRETVIGWPLGALALLWLLGRAAMLVADHLPVPLAALCDLAFLPALAFACGRPVMVTENRRNYQFIAMLVALFAVNLAMHLGALGIVPAWIRQGGWVGVDLYIVMILVMTGRIVPMFTRNATRADGIVNSVVFDQLAVGGMVGVLLLDAVGAPEAVVAPVAAATAIAVSGRMWRWGTRHTLRHPLLWILHAGHAWVAIGLGLRALALAVPAVGGTIALHALTVGAIGSLTLGMMARVAMGHTGRLLAVPPIVAVAFGMMVMAATVRVVAPLFGLAAYLPAMIVSGLLFAAAFAIYLWVYTPILLSPRPDGRPG